MAAQKVELLLNEDKCCHGDVVANLLPRATQIECMIAFAKESGLKVILNQLKKSLEGGLKARFAIGLDFYQTDPELLWQLLALSGKYSLKLYIGNSNYTFHPKIYAIFNGKSYSVIVGSANLTHGGLRSNHEASTRIDDTTGFLFKSVRSYINSLIKNNDLVLANPEQIFEYERRHRIHKVQQLLAKRRADKACKRAKKIKGADTQMLGEILKEMRDDSSDMGFEAAKIRRMKNSERAFRKIGEIAGLKYLDSVRFVEYYEALIGCFHSGGLHRGKNIIAEKSEVFRRALVDLMHAVNLTPCDAYKLLLNHFQHIPSAGVNVISEILHAIDCNKFAVMNKNAVSGLRLAGIYGFPLRPNKKNVSAERYSQFCQEANTVGKELGLSDFTELDALFNYAYWQDEDADDGV